MICLKGRNASISVSLLGILNKAGHVDSFVQHEGVAKAVHDCNLAVR